jgi:hypothetical protein
MYTSDLFGDIVSGTIAGIAAGIVLPATLFLATGLEIKV